MGPFGPNSGVYFFVFIAQIQFDKKLTFAL